MPVLSVVRTRYALAAAAGLSAFTLAACGSSSPTTSASSGPGAPLSAAGSGQVLPVASNPISNTATAQVLKIDHLLVENNVGPSGSTAPDHIEIQLSNTGGGALNGFEVYYTETDATTKTSESYYTKLPASFTIPAGGKRTIHFDNSGATDHFRVNKFDIYHTTKNAIDITVEVSATGGAPVTATVQKSAGGAETAD